MARETLEQLTYIKTKILSLEGNLTLEQARQLVALPSQLGFTDREEFLTAMREALKGRDDPSTPNVGDGSLNEDQAGGGVKDVITSQPSHDAVPESVADERVAPPAIPSDDDDPKNAIKRLIAAGKSRAAIARELGVTTSQVQSVRKSLGLVQPRRRKEKKSETTVKRTSRRRSDKS